MVRQIYQWRTYGYSLRKIAELLQERNVVAPKGSARWDIETLNKLLHNEKYTGSVMLQKTYVLDVLASKQKPNNGQMAKFYIRNTHQRIITKEMFDAVNGAPHLPKVIS